MAPPGLLELYGIQPSAEYVTAWQQRQQLPLPPYLAEYYGLAPQTPAAESQAPPALTPPAPGIDQPGFIDHSDGANLRTRPAELPDSVKLAPAPLAPATRVFVSGTYPGHIDWWYVTAVEGGQALCGYVQGLRVTTKLPEPLATLHAVQSGERLEPLAARIYQGDIQPGRDLRFYENVIFKKLDRVMNDLTKGGTKPLEEVEPKLLDNALRKIEDELRGRIQTGDFPPGVLKELQEDGIPAGRKLSLNDNRDEDMSA